MTLHRSIPHEPMRPLWRCRNCAAEWPCQPARLALLREYEDDVTALLVYLGGQLLEAREQLHQLNPGRPIDLTARFITWARRGEP
ncbi:flavin reductase [Micromonospora sp. WMMD1102]|uniref:flavin reductase n=1 Tax=Micromonospora sp. WMMD1102 TaxID=3016105 RepID=UPI0024150EB6|nr:flavin reductase [Micromonospora sp. WMMD1102]MDG4788468.1 flavin reductase [Micromonospora sp. WMMD1102]